MITREQIVEIIDDNIGLDWAAMCIVGHEESADAILALIEQQNARIIELEAQLQAYHDNPLKRIILINGAWVGQSFADMDAQATEYQARITELETTLRTIHQRVWNHDPLSMQDMLIMRDISAVLIPPPLAA